MGRDAPAPGVRGRAARITTQDGHGICEAGCQAAGPSTLTPPARRTPECVAGVLPRPGTMVHRKGLSHALSILPGTESSAAYYPKII